MAHFGIRHPSASAGVDPRTRDANFRAALENLKISLNGGPTLSGVRRIETELVSLIELTKVMPLKSDTRHYSYLFSRIADLYRNFRFQGDMWNVWNPNVSRLQGIEEALGPILQELSVTIDMLLAEFDKSPRISSSDARFYARNMAKELTFRITDFLENHENSWEDLDLISDGLKFLIARIEIYSPGDRYIEIFKIPADRLERLYPDSRIFRTTNPYPSIDSYARDLLQALQLNLSGFEAYDARKPRVDSPVDSARGKRTGGDATNISAKYLMGLLNGCLQRAREPDYLDKALRDWMRGDLLTINGASFFKYQKRFLKVPDTLDYEGKPVPQHQASVDMMKRFCRENKLSDQQADYLFFQGNQHAIFGLLSLFLPPLQNTFANYRIDYFPMANQAYTKLEVCSLAASGQFSIKGEMEIYIKNMAKDEYTLMRICMTAIVEPNNITKINIEYVFNYHPNLQVLIPLLNKIYPAGKYSDEAGHSVTILPATFADFSTRTNKRTG